MRATNPVEPHGLHDMHAPRAISGEEAVDVVVARLVDRPERRARAVTREPVEREVARVDRPDAPVARLEASNRRFLAHMPQRVFAFASIWRSAHAGNMTSAHVPPSQRRSKLPCSSSRPSARTVESPGPAGALP